MLIEAVKTLCPICQAREATQLHHLFPQTRQNRRIYGALIDEPFNLLPVCEHCHVSHREMAGRIEGELWFREQVRKAGLPLPPASKTLQAKARFGRM